MTTDITELAQREKFEAWWEREYKHLESSKYTDAVPHIKYGFWMAYQAGGAELVEAVEKAQGMETYWKTQCRGITDHCEELQARIAELESHTVKPPVHPTVASEKLDDETLQELIEFRRTTFEYHSKEGNKVQTIIHGVTLAALRELQDRRKADSEPVATLDVQSRRPDGNKFALVFSSAAHKLPDDVYFLYRHAQPAPVTQQEQMFGIGSIFKPQRVSEQEADCDDCVHYQPQICHGEGCPAISEKPAQPAPEAEREPIAWPNDAYLARGVVDGEAGSEDAGPGYIPVYREAGPQPAPDDYQHLRELYHAQEKRLFKIAQRIKGPAFDKYSHSPSQAIDVLEVAIFGEDEACRAAMLQAQSDDDGEPTDDERIMAIEGIHNCERCGDEGWVVGEMGITRCACVQAGNSPVIPEGSTAGMFNSARALLDALYEFGPDEIAISEHVTNLEDALRNAAAPTGIPVIPEGYVMVPKEPTDEMLAAAKEWTGLTSTAEVVYIKMLAAAPQEVK